MLDSVAQPVEFQRLGLVEYGECWARMRELHAQVASGARGPAVMLVEHPAVLTLGKHANPIFLKFTEAALAAQGIKIYQIDRGGEVTAHEPGQLVAYPILRLTDFALSPKRLVSLLESVVIELLAAYGVTAGVDSEHPGVWVGHEKVCAIGLRIKERASLHGIALNVRNDLSTFAKIVPCGIRGRGVTSLSRLLGREIGVSEVQERFAEILGARLEGLLFHADGKRGLPSGDLAPNMIPGCSRA